MSSVATWVQAGAALAQVAVAVLLYRLTRQYVHFTGDLVKATHAQLEIARAALNSGKEEGRRDFLERTRRLQQALISLPTAEGHSAAERLLREAALWTTDDLNQFAALAASIGQETGSLASKIVQNLKWIGDRVGEVRSVSPDFGYNYNRFPWPRWKFHFMEADLALAKLLSIA